MSASSLYNGLLTNGRAVMRAGRLVIKDFNPDQARVAHGRWASEAGEGGRDRYVPAAGSSSAGIKPAASDADAQRFLSEVEATPEYKAISKFYGDKAQDVKGGTVEGITYSPQDVRAWSLEKYSDPSTGKMLPERQALHGQIAASMLNPRAVAPAGVEPKAVLLMGPPGGGKSSVGLPVAKVYEGRNWRKWATRQLGGEWTTIAPDDIKAQLPGYAGYNASLFQEESSKIGEQDVTNAALDQRHNVIFDLTGANKGKMTGLVNSLGARGYGVHIVNIDVAPHVSASRAWSRFVSSGRILPPRYSYEGVGRKPSATYNALKSSPYVRTYASINTDSFPARTVESSGWDQSKLP